MKLNIFLTFLALALAALVGYGIYTAAENNANCVAITLGTSICLTTTTVAGLGMQYESSRIGVNIRVLSSLFFLLFTIINIVFAKTDATTPCLIITNGLLLVSYLAILYKLATLKHV